MGGTSSKPVTAVGGAGLCVVDKAFVTTAVTRLHFRDEWLISPAPKKGLFQLRNTLEWFGATLQDLNAQPTVTDHVTGQAWFKVSGSKIFSAATGELVCQVQVVPWANKHGTDQVWPSALAARPHAARLFSRPA